MACALQKHWMGISSLLPCWLPVSSKGLWPLLCRHLESHSGLWPVWLLCETWKPKTKVGSGIAWRHCPPDIWELAIDQRLSHAETSFYQKKVVSPLHTPRAECSLWYLPCSLLGLGRDHGVWSTEAQVIGTHQGIYYGETQRMLAGLAFVLQIPWDLPQPVPYKHTGTRDRLQILLRIYIEPSSILCVKDTRSPGTDCTSGL
jgi:hypothetical protein